MRCRVEYDLEYIRSWSLWLDLRILLLTFVRGFINRQPSTTSHAEGLRLDEHRHDRVLAGDRAEMAVTEIERP